MRAELRAAPARGLARLRRRRTEPLDTVDVGEAFFRVLARAPDGWTQTLDLLRPDVEQVLDTLGARMATTELSRIAPYAETDDERAALTGLRRLVEACVAGGDALQVRVGPDASVG